MAMFCDKREEWDKKKCVTQCDQYSVTFDKKEQGKQVNMTFCDKGERRGTKTLKRSATSIMVRP